VPRSRRVYTTQPRVEWREDKVDFGTICCPEGTLPPVPEGRSDLSQARRAWTAPPQKSRPSGTEPFPSGHQTSRTFLNLAPFNPGEPSPQANRPERTGDDCMVAHVLTVFGLVPIRPAVACSCRRCASRQQNSPHPVKREQF
jgi:hypothetical protein